MSYLQAIVGKYPSHLRDDLISAGLSRLARSLPAAARKCPTQQKWSAYLRCAMHSAVIDELRARLLRDRRSQPLETVDGSAVEADRPAHVKVSLFLEYPSPETVLIMNEE